MLKEWIEKKSIKKTRDSSHETMIIPYKKNKWILSLIPNQSNIEGWSSEKKLTKMNKKIT
jgi:hypothetical protein